MRGVINEPKPASRVLDLVVTGPAFDMIAAGKKKEEYREIKKYWSRRLVLACSETEVVFCGFDIVRFRRGYTNAFFDVECKGIRIGIPNPEWTLGIVSQKKCYIIELGEILKTTA